MRAKLDTRPARTDLLTSRECAKLFCAEIVCAATYFDGEEIRDVLAYLVGNKDFWKYTTSPPPKAALVKMAQRRKASLTTESAQGAEMVLGRLAGGLCHLAKAKVVKKALQWCLEHLDDIYNPPPRYGMMIDSSEILKVIVDMEEERSQGK